MRTVFAVIATLLTAAVVLQFYLAAVGVFSAPEDELFAIHGTNGRVVIALLALLTLISAALARAGKRTAWLSVLPFVLVLLQTVLFIIVGAIFNIDEESATVPIGATIILGLHALNGLAILGVSIVLTRRAWVLAGGRGVTTEGVMTEGVMTERAATATAAAAVVEEPKAASYSSPESQSSPQ